MRYSSEVSIAQLEEEQVLEIREAVWEHRVNGVGFPSIPALIKVQFNVTVSRGWCFQQSKLAFTERETEARAQYRLYALEALDKLQQAAQDVYREAARGEPVAITNVQDLSTHHVLVTDTKTQLAALKELRGINESRRKLLGLDADPVLEQIKEESGLDNADRDMQDLINLVRQANETKLREARHAQTKP